MQEGEIKSAGPILGKLKAEMQKNNKLKEPHYAYHFLLFGRWTSKEKAQRSEEDIHNSYNCHEPWKPNGLCNGTTGRRTLYK